MAAPMGSGRGVGGCWAPAVLPQRQVHRTPGPSGALGGTEPRGEHLPSPLLSPPLPTRLAVGALPCEARERCPRKLSPEHAPGRQGAAPPLPPAPGPWSSRLGPGRGAPRGDPCGGRRWMGRCQRGHLLAAPGKVNGRPAAVGDGCVVGGGPRSRAVSWRRSPGLLGCTWLWRSSPAPPGAPPAPAPPPALRQSAHPAPRLRLAGDGRGLRARLRGRAQCPPPCAGAPHPWRPRGLAAPPPKPGRVAVGTLAVAGQGCWPGVFPSGSPESGRDPWWGPRELRALGQEEVGSPGPDVGSRVGEGRAQSPPWWLGRTGFGGAVLPSCLPRAGLPREPGGPCSAPSCSPATSWRQSPRPCPSSVPGQPWLPLVSWQELSWGTWAPWWSQGCAQAGVGRSVSKCLPGWEWGLLCPGCLLGVSGRAAGPGPTAPPSARRSPCQWAGVWPRGGGAGDPLREPRPEGRLRLSVCSLPVSVPE